MALNKSISDDGALSVEQPEHVEGVSVDQPEHVEGVSVDQPEHDEGVNVDQSERVESAMNRVQNSIGRFLALFNTVCVDLFVGGQC
jgi:hypothetical protein